MRNIERAEKTILEDALKILDWRPDEVELQVPEFGHRNKVLIVSRGKEIYVIKSESCARKRLFYETNSLSWEANMLERLKSQGLPVPSVLHVGNSTVESYSDFLILEYLHGTNAMHLSISTDSYTPFIDRRLGELSKQIAENKVAAFSLPQHPSFSHDDAFSFVKAFVTALRQEANTYCPDLYDQVFRVENIIVNLEWAFEENIVPCTVHQDLWYGNVLIKDGDIAGLIDFEGVLFGDELMSYMFHGTQRKCKKDYLYGYGKAHLSIKEKARICIYRLVQILKLQLELRIKKEMQPNGRHWLTERFNEEVKHIMNNDFGGLE